MKGRQPIFVRAWRQRRGYTIEQLAAHIGISKSALSRIERGERPYNQDFLEAAAEFLECRPADLITRDPGGPAAPLDVWNRIAEPNRAQALKVLETFAQPFDPDAPRPGKTKRTKR